MLPYRLRPPIYGGRLKKLKSKESFIDQSFPYREGGPMERAIKSDLLALFPLYQSQLSRSFRTMQLPKPGFTNATTGTVADLSIPPAAAFRAFKEVFRAAKVALLFRSGSVGFLPQRCDRNSHSQLVYAVCLSMLRDDFALLNSTRDDEPAAEPENSSNDCSKDNNFYIRVSLSVFLLYALYETNPLDIGRPSTDADWLALLPMGAQNRENPKLIHRQAYKSPVRIDAEHYSLLLQLGALASAMCCQCQAIHRRHGIELESRSKPSTPPEQQDCGNQDSMSYQSCCKMLAVATDLGAVLSRMISNRMFEFCSYTGPCGLEALAGHADYPYPTADCQPTPKTVQLDQEDCSLNKKDSDATVGDLCQELASVEKHLQKYVHCRQKIRMPVIQQRNSNRKANRIRDALLPMFPQTQRKPGVNGVDDPIARLLCSIRGETETLPNNHQQRKILKNRRHVSFVELNNMLAESIATENGETDTATETMTIRSRGDPNEAQIPTTFELDLPDSFASELQDSVHAALQELLNRDQSILFSNRHALSDQSAASFGLDASLRDGLSTLGNDAVSIANTSIATGKGQAALRDLLAHVKLPTKEPPVKRNLKRSLLGSGFLLESNLALADDNEFEKKLEGDNESVVSALSSDTEDDLISVAASCVGQNALQSLLDATVRKGSGSKKQPPRKNKRQKRSKGGTHSKLKSNVPGNDSSVSFIHVADISLQGSLRPDQEDRFLEGEDDSFDSLPTIDGDMDNGKAALASLIAAASSCRQKGSRTG